MENGMNYLWFHHQNKMQGGDGRYGRLTGSISVPTMFDDYADPELDHKTRKVADRVSENLNIVANDASLAFFRIQEHVRKTLPHLVDQKHEVQEIQQQVQGACFDTEYATNAVKTMNGSSTHFQNIQDLLKNAMFMKQQIEYEENRSDDALEITEENFTVQTGVQPLRQSASIQNNSLPSSQTVSQHSRERPSSQTISQNRTIQTRTRPKSQPTSEVVNINK